MLRFMRGGVRVWKRGLNGHGLRHATAYALQGGCDAAQVSAQVSAGADVGAAYAEADARVTRWSISTDGLVEDQLDANQLRTWIDGRDPQGGQVRGRAGVSPSTHLFYDATVNAPKTYSLAAVLHPELRVAFDALSERITAETLTAWQEQLSTRRGKGGRQRIGIARIEAVQLDHERSRSLDPHAHRHLWLNAKVLGEDGRWSNVDSQQVFRHQNLVNARGELAARTDQDWRKALASFGLSLNDDGEIAELAHLVQPMSKRASQIEANKERYERQWRDENPGREPSPRLVAMWDSRAWAEGREQKPGEIDEEDWQATVRRELADLDPAILRPRAPLPTMPTEMGFGSVDRQELANYALGWVDQRSIRSGGRFSRIDLRAAATMAVASTQFVASPAVLHAVAREVEVMALSSIESLAPQDTEPVPEDVKTLRLNSVGQTRARIRERAAMRAALGTTAPANNQIIDEAIAAVNENRSEAGKDAIQVDEGQYAAAAVVAGSSPVVLVEGPAGAGKTTMLTIAHEAITATGGRMVTVAPTMKAAQVAAQELGSESSSLHGLLYAYGYRWRTTDSGATVWRRLQVGDVDVDGNLFMGPSADTVLTSTDVIVCDEAGMVDLDAMLGLFTVADETGARVALVGDPHQVRPVGHSGAMRLVASETPDEAVAFLATVHRFRNADDPRQTDTVYADITHDMRTVTNEDQAVEVAYWLTANDKITASTTAETLISDAANEWLSARESGESVTLMAADNDAVTALNQTIQAALVRAGELDTAVTLAARDGAQLHVGDLVATRKNHRDGFTVSNREQWTITDITDAHITVTGGLDGRTETMPLDYARTNVSLAYALTTHGAQGVTSRRAITVVTDQMSSENFYVGMTRGSLHNRAFVVAQSEQLAVRDLADVLLRGKDDLSDSALRKTVRDDIKRAGHDIDHTKLTNYMAWDSKARRFGDLERPELVFNRVAIERDELVAKIREVEDAVSVAKDQIKHDHKPAVTTADRMGITSQEHDQLDQKLASAQAKLDARLKELEPLKTRWSRLEEQIADLATEIEYRTTLDPETAATENSARAAAPTPPPADRLRRPHGLSQNLDTERAARNTAIARAQTHRNQALATLENAEIDIHDHTETLARLNALYANEEQQLQNILDARHPEIVNAIKADLDHLAGISKWRIGAKKQTENARRAFTSTWHTPPPETVTDDWIQSMATKHVSAMPDIIAQQAQIVALEAKLAATSDNLTKSRNRADTAKTTISRADKTEERATQELDELNAEKELRANLTPETLRKEDQQRFAIAAKKHAAIPAPAQVRPAVNTTRPITNDSLER